MTVPNRTPPTILPDFAAPAAIAALRAHGDFGNAMRLSATGIVEKYQGGHLLNWLMDDRGRLLFGYLALFLHYSRDPADGTSGLTPTRMKAICAELDVCSAGRAGAMLSLMRFSGYLSPDIQVVDRRQRRLLATDKLHILLRERWLIHFSAMAPLLGDGPAMLHAFGDPAFERPFVHSLVDRFRAGFRPVHAAPSLGLFGERNAGILILMSLMIAGADDDAMPPQQAVPISIAALARRFAVSRPHVLKLLRDAASEGFIERSGVNQSAVVILPRLAEAVQDFFATTYLFFADCAREAMAANVKENRAAG